MSYRRPNAVVAALLTAATLTSCTDKPADALRPEVTLPAESTPNAVGLFRCAKDNVLYFSLELLDERRVGVTFNKIPQSITGGNQDLARTLMRGTTGKQYAVLLSDLDSASFMYGPETAFNIYSRDTQTVLTLEDGISGSGALMTDLGTNEITVASGKDVLVLLNGRLLETGGFAPDGWKINLAGSPHGKGRAAIINNGQGVGCDVAGRSFTFDS